jgi:heme-degrading monooxygenase HmoA
MNLTDRQFARTPEPPYYAVIFTSQRNDVDEGYGDMGDRMMELAREQDGFLGVESARDANGFGFTISYWRDEAAIRAWKMNTEHRAAQAKGQARWYDAYTTRIAKVERDYGFESV